VKAPEAGPWARLSRGIVLNPIWISEHRLRTKIRNVTESLAFGSSERWLDVGCGLRPYESYFPGNGYVGVDVEVSGREKGMKSPDCYYDGRALPFADGSFDGAFSTQVLEHVPDPAAVLQEMHRVVKPGGALVISLPFVWQEHEEPYDFFRFTRFGITELLERTGFECRRIEPDSGAVETLAVTFNNFLTQNWVPRIPGAGRVMAAVICFPIQSVALLLQKVLPDRGQLYLNLVIHATRKAEPID